MIDTRDLFDEAGQRAREERDKGEIASANQWETIRSAAATLVTLEYRIAKKKEEKG